MTGPIGHLSASSRRLIGVGASLALGIVLATGVLCWLLWRDAQQNAEREISGLSVLIAEQTARAMQAVDLQVREIRDRAVHLGVADEAAFRAAMGSEEIHRDLIARTLNLPQVSGLTVIDASGRLVNFNRSWPIPNMDLSDRDHLHYFLTHPDDDGVYISLPVRTRADARWTVFLARQVRGGDGKLAGLVLGAVDLQYFADLYASIGLQEGGLITLLRRDGVAMAEYPERPGIIGSSLPTKSAWYQLSKNDSAHYRFTAPFGGGAPLFVALKHVRGYGLVVNVAISEPFVFAEWRRLALFLVLGSGPGLAVMLGLLRALVTQFRRIEMAEAQARQRNRELEETRHTLDIMLQTMEEGLLMVTADGTLAVCNRRAQEILGIADAAMGRRPRIATLIARCTGGGRGETPRQELSLLAAQSEATDTPRRCERSQPDGSVVEVRTVPLASGGFVRTFTDITERRRAEDQIRRAALYDDLTGLPNRFLLAERIAAGLTDTARSAARWAVLFLDLDRFKIVNDTRGHETGDHLLREVAARLIALVRDTDTVARIGGDEFVVVLNDVAGRDAVTALAWRMVQEIGRPFVIEGHEIGIGLSAGVAIFPDDGRDAETLMRNADLALYRAKNGGRSLVCQFDQATDELRRRRILLENELHEALRLGQFHLEYQPIWNLTENRVCAMEALVRWNHPTRGRIAPADFIPIAEKIGLIVDLGNWVLETACAEAATWRETLNIAVNVSPVQFRQAGFPRQVTRVLTASGLPPERLELEITEGVLLEDTPQIGASFRALEAQGVKLVLDDFGSANANVSYLRRYSFKKMKIDRSFIRDICGDEESALLLEAILHIGRALKLDVVAEGVESNDQLQMLRRHGCSHVQGYLLGRPVPAAIARRMAEPDEPTLYRTA